MRFLNIFNLADFFYKKADSGTNDWKVDLDAKFVPPKSKTIALILSGFFDGKSVKYDAQISQTNKDSIISKLNDAYLYDKDLFSKAIEDASPNIPDNEKEKVINEKLAEFVGTYKDALINNFDNVKKLHYAINRLSNRVALKSDKDKFINKAYDKVQDFKEELDSLVKDVGLKREIAERIKSDLDIYYSCMEEKRPTEGVVNKYNLRIKIKEEDSSEAKVRFKKFNDAISNFSKIIGKRYKDIVPTYSYAENSASSFYKLSTDTPRNFQDLKKSLLEIGVKIYDISSRASNDEFSEEADKAQLLQLVKNAIRQFISDSDGLAKELAADDHDKYMPMFLSIKDNIDAFYKSLITQTGKESTDTTNDSELISEIGKLEVGAITLDKIDKVSDDAISALVGVSGEDKDIIKKIDPSSLSYIKYIFGKIPQIEEGGKNSASYNSLREMIADIEALMKSPTVDLLNKIKENFDFGDKKFTVYFIDGVERPLTGGNAHYKDSFAKVFSSIKSLLSDGKVIFSTDDFKYEGYSEAYQEDARIPFWDRVLSEIKSSIEAAVKAKRALKSLGIANKIITKITEEIGRIKDKSSTKDNRDLLSKLIEAFIRVLGENNLKEDNSDIQLIKNANANNLILLLNSFLQTLTLNDDDLFMVSSKDHIDEALANPTKSGGESPKPPASKSKPPEAPKTDTVWSQLSSEAEAKLNDYLTNKGISKILKNQISPKFIEKIKLELQKVVERSSNQESREKLIELIDKFVKLLDKGIKDEDASQFEDVSNAKGKPSKKDSLKTILQKIKSVLQLQDVALYAISTMEDLDKSIADSASKSSTPKGSASKSGKPPAAAKSKINKNDPHSILLSSLSNKDKEKDLRELAKRLREEIDSLAEQDGDSDDEKDRKEKKREELEEKIDICEGCIQQVKTLIRSESGSKDKTTPQRERLQRLREDREAAKKNGNQKDDAGTMPDVENPRIKEIKEKFNNWYNKLDSQGKSSDSIHLSGVIVNSLTDEGSLKSNLAKIQELQSKISKFPPSLVRLTKAAEFLKELIDLAGKKNSNS